MTALLPFPTLNSNDPSDLRDAINQIARIRLQDIAANNNTQTQINNLGSGGVTSFTGDGVLLSNVSSVGAVIDSLSKQSSHFIFCGPTSGTAASPTFRSLIMADLPSFGQITASLGSDVLLSNVSNYFDGPSVSQGTIGTWFVSGTVTVFDSAGLANCFVKLWDGTTVISSCYCTTPGANFFESVSLSGYIVSPAGNLRISVQDSSSTSGKILFNATGNSKDSTITAFRIA